VLNTQAQYVHSARIRFYCLDASFTDGWRRPIEANRHRSKCFSADSIPYSAQSMQKICSQMVKE